MTAPELSQGFVGALETAGASIVRVAARRRYALSGVAWSDEIIVTTSRAVEREDGIKVGLAGGEEVRASLVGRDPSTDLAVLRLDGAQLTPAAWSDGNDLKDLKVGQLVLRAGRPGKDIRATAGILSVIEGPWRTALGGRIDGLLQSDAATFPGFSGGALLSLSGEILGVNSAALSRGFAVTLPAATVRRVVEMLLAHGRVRRGYLGIGIQPVRLPEGLDQETGLLVVSVEKGGAAEAAGLVLGDTLLSLEDKPLRHFGDLQAQLGEDGIGKSMAARVLRGGTVIELALTVGERPS
jgi:S1-C subfamily serine protease